jgi:hypothetical protein
VFKVSHTVHHSIRGECEISGGRRITLDFTWHGERLPGILLLPRGGARVPAALLLHGLNLDKERMSGLAGQALLNRGIASLALDLPLHGERRASGDLTHGLNPLDMMRRWRAAQEECSVAIKFLAARPEIDPSRLALMGYSLGAFLGLRVAAMEPMVRSMIVAGGGDLPEFTPFISIVRAVADPLKFIRKFAGRPLLMVHGRYDKAVTPLQAERLFQAAGQPKQMLWWECGHVIPEPAIDYAAAWLAQQFGTLRVLSAESIRSLLQ